MKVDICPEGAVAPEQRPSADIIFH